MENESNSKNLSSVTLTNISYCNRTNHSTKKSEFEENIPHSIPLDDTIYSLEPDYKLG